MKQWGKSDIQRAQLANVQRKLRKQNKLSVFSLFLNRCAVVCVVPVSSSSRPQWNVAVFGLGNQLQVFISKDVWASESKRLLTLPVTRVFKLIKHYEEAAVKLTNCT